MLTPNIVQLNFIHLEFIFISIQNFELSRTEIKFKKKQIMLHFYIS